MKKLKLFITLCFLLAFLNLAIVPVSYAGDARANFVDSRTIQPLFLPPIVGWIVATAVVAFVRGCSQEAGRSVWNHGTGL